MLKPKRHHAREPTHQYLILPRLSIGCRLSARQRSVQCSAQNFKQWNDRKIRNMLGRAGTNETDSPCIAKFFVAAIIVLLYMYKCNRHCYKRK